MPADRDVLLSARDLHKAYQLGRVDVSVLRGASLEVGRGEFLAVMGRSGSGKSTLLHVIGALDPPDRGSVTLDGQDVFRMPPRGRERIRNRDIGFVFQFYHLLPELNLLENVLVPGMVGRSLTAWVRQRRGLRRKAIELLEKLGLEHRLQHRPRELSGGERQRVAIARALLNEPRLLLADEPTGNLDRASGKAILDHLVELNDGGQTIVMVTHDADVAALAHRCVHLKEGQVTSRHDPRDAERPVQSVSRR
ncbi:MAG: ABC transporter ATP-binding protein [Phycisphaerales bacterium]|nr:MAG: ABC transporter ATP-binding protein [Phycisphaerales bacterium]